MVLRTLEAMGPQHGFGIARRIEQLSEDALRAWTDYIESEMAQNFLVRLEDDLTTDQAALCRAHLNEVPGVKVINQLDYINGLGTTAIWLTPSFKNRPVQGVDPWGSAGHPG